MKHYNQLNREQRYQISGLKKAGLNLSEIADEVGVDEGPLVFCLVNDHHWKPRPLGQGPGSFIFSLALCFLGGVG